VVAYSPVPIFRFVTFPAGTGVGVGSAGVGVGVRAGADVGVGRFTGFPLGTGEGDAPSSAGSITQPLKTQEKYTNVRIAFPLSTEFQLLIAGHSEKCVEFDTRSLKL
jgi:hypothetical protein